MQLLRVFLKYCYRPQAKKRTLLIRAKNMLLRDENEGARYIKRRFAQQEVFHV